MRITPEQAQRILEENPSVDPINRDYYEAIIRGELPSFFLTTFTRFKLFSDELPEDFVGFWHPDYPSMKCRGNTILAILLNLQAAIDDGVIKKDTLISAVQSLGAKTWNFMTGPRRLTRTSPEEISLLNQVLDTTISHLQQQYGIQVDDEQIRRKLIADRAEKRRWFEALNLPDNFRDW